MPTTSQQDVVRITSPPRPIRWWNWALMDGGPSAWVWVPIVLLLSWAAAERLGHAGWGAAVAVLVLVPLWRLWLPIHYELNSEGIEQRVAGRLRKIPWRRFRAWREHHDGAYLWHSSEPLRRMLDGYYLPLHRRKRLRSKALEALQYHLGPPEEERGESRK